MHWTRFDEAWEECAPYTLLLKAQAQVLWEWVGRVPASELAELGVYRGGSAMVLQRARPDAVLHLFDTFAGYPEADRSHDELHEDPAWYAVGRFDVADDLGEILKRLTDGWRTRVYIGRFPESLPPVWIPRLAFVHLDCDLYESTKAGLTEFWPRLVSGGVIIGDDFGQAGARLALEEWKHELAPGALITEYIGTGQRVLQKR